MTNKFHFPALSKMDEARLQSIREKFTDLQKEIESLPTSRYVSLALGDLERADLWTYKAIAFKGAGDKK